TLGMLDFFIRLFRPIINLFIFVIRHLPGLKHLEKKQKEIFLTKEDLKTIFHIGVKQGLIDESNKEIFYSLFEYSSTYVREIMVPLVDIELVGDNKKVLDIVKKSKKTGYSRVPVFKEHVYNVVGYVNVLDLFDATAGESISKYVRPPYYVPETKKIDDLFIEMNDNKLPMVFVVDEYGGVSGIVTQEDIVEEIVGEIDEKPQEEQKELISRVNNFEWEVSGDLNIDDINEKIDLDLPKEGFETIAGFVEYFLGKIPSRKETFIYKGYKFIVSEATPTCVEKVKIKKIIKAGKQ
ncbi:MAG: hemolysin family protein, partial [Spirochaetes bacterium]|nr:hemolysin family protein [Spirochaetota bacterium]